MTLTTDTEPTIYNASDLADLAAEMGLAASDAADALRSVGLTVTSNGKVYGPPEAWDAAADAEAR